MQAIFLVDEGRNVKTATDRAAEAIETAETIFADEMGATLDLSPAARVALIVTIAAAIEAAVAEDRERLTACCNRRRRMLVRARQEINEQFGG